jgi:arabinosaccharide transport system substrate-binding protein
MFYNKEVMDAAGVDIDGIKTWDDYIAAGQKVSQGDVTMCPMETTGGFPEKALMLMNGGSAYDKDGNLIIDSAQNVEALQFAADLVQKYNICSVAPGGNVQSAEFYEAMNSGLYASIWEPQWYMERFQSMLPDLAGKIVVRPMPVWADKPGTFASSMGGGTGTAIIDQINKNNVQLAKDFLAFGKLTYDGAVSIWVDLGFDPMFKAVYDDPALTAPLPYFGNEDVFSTVKAMQPSLAPEYVGGQYADVMTVLQNAFYEVLENGASPADALKDVRSQVESME